MDYFLFIMTVMKKLLDMLEIQPEVDSGSFPLPETRRQ
jgi:hypothetical protein